MRCQSSPWAWGCGRVGAVRDVGSPRWSPVSAPAGAGSGTLTPPRQQHSKGATGLRVSLGLGCHWAEETGTGLGSVEPGMAGKGSHIPELRPPTPVPAPWGTEAPVLGPSHPCPLQGAPYRCFALCQGCPGQHPVCPAAPGQAVWVQGAWARVQAGTDTEAGGARPQGYPLALRADVSMAQEHWEHWERWDRCVWCGVL